MADSINDILAPEILLHILTFLYPMDLVDLIPRVCRLWEELARSSALWIHLRIVPEKECNYYR